MVHTAAHGLVGTLRAKTACPLVVIAVLLAGCGDEADTVDASQVEQEIKKSVSTATTEITSVSCPDDVESETGATFTCHTKLSGGGSADVEVEETRAPNQFAYSFKPGTVELAGSSVDKAVEEDLAADGFPDATVNCPEVVKVKAGTTVTCPVSGVRGTGVVTFEFSDASGSVEGASVEGGS